MHKIYPILLFSLLILLGFAQYANGQTTQTEFGKNRVQFHQDFAEWSQYESRNFITYWYGEGRLVGQAVVQMAEYDFYEIQGILEHRMNDKIEIIVYKDLTDLKQSNIGSEEAFMNTGGQTKIVGNKMFVYFNGDHNHLRRQIREGVASVYLNAMLFGSNLQEIVQNAVMMNLPEWFKDGLISYVGEEWNTALDNQLRDMFLSGKYADFEEMAEANPKLAGHSLWYFIGQQYGHSTVSNLLYLTRINRSIESGFLYVLGSTYYKTTDSWYKTFLKRYEDEAKELAKPINKEITIKNKRNLPVSQVKISPDGLRIAYVQNEIGRQKVWVQELATGERKLIFKSGSRNPIQATDYNYPLLAWSPTNMELAIIYEKRDVIKMLRYNVQTKEKKEDVMPNQFQRIYSLDYAGPNDMVLSAAVRGQSDLFLYFTVNRQSQRLTTDIWDDLDVSFTQVRGQRGILFASNRPDSLNVPVVLDSVLPIQHYDIFYLNLDSIGFRSAGELVQVTHTPHADERQPISLDSTWFSFITDETGVYNRKTGFIEDYIHHYETVVRYKDGNIVRFHADSLITNVLDSVALAQVDSVWKEAVIKQRAVNHFSSNCDRNLVEQSKARRSGRYVEMQQRDGRYNVFVGEAKPDEITAPKPTSFNSRKVQVVPMPQAPKIEPPKKNVLDEVGNKPIDTSKLPQEKQDTGKIDIDNYLFQSEFDDDEVPTKTAPTPKPETTPEEVAPETVQPLVYLPVTPQTEAPKQKLQEFRSSRIIPYRTKFRTDFVTTQLDNGMLFDGLNSYAGVPQDFGYPPPGILLKANFKDLLEDYEFEGGIRVPTSFNGAEYFLTYHDKKKRLDKRINTYYRRLRFTEDPAQPTSGIPLPPSSAPSTDPLKYENRIFLTQYQIRYPLDVFTSLRATATFRMDNSNFLASDLRTLEAEPLRTQRVGVKGEFVFDNTLDVALNVKNGTRYKIFGEMLKGLKVDLGESPEFKLNNGFMTILGADFRHYQRLMKWSVLAGRFATATSFGQEKILYMLGGTDNWMFPQFDNNISQPNAEDFAFRTVATNARGFKLNARNGNSYAVFNGELRVPVLRYLFPRSQTNFVRNFQVVGFFDIGTAWQGVNPFNEQSPLNTWEAQGNNVSIKVNYFRDPIIFGYGTGIRTLLFGYMIRLDYAWGVETRVVQKPILHFSIGMDF
ncbi:MAG: hypothetical protein IT258_23010 [Saprospiraceae bacterium]|nr:hypothetical protein [Saprospiraceae bacterium]